MGTTRQPPNFVVDRRATDLPGRSGDYVDITVADPWSSDGGRISSKQNVRHDPLGRMGARHQIDAAQLAAGRRWQADYDRSGGGLRTNFASDAPVSGGGEAKDQINDQMVDAYARLKATRGVLGVGGFQLIEQIAGMGLSVAEAAADRGLITKSEIEYLGRRFRECLETLAIHYGYAQEPPHKKQHKPHRREPELMSDRTAVVVKNGNRVVSISGGRWQPQRRGPGGSSKDFDPWESIGPPHSDYAAALAVASR